MTHGRIARAWEYGLVLVIGHRGAPRTAPENTPAAFESADRMGADGVELDVWWAPTAGLVVHHDAPPDDPELLAALPTLSEVLDACGDRMLVNVEIKNAADEADVDLDVVGPTIAELIRRGRRHAHRWLISSFSWSTIELCRKVSTAVPTAFLVVDATGDAVERTVRAGHRAIHPWADALTGEIVGRCHAAGLAVNTWTCNDPARLVEFAAMGVDGVCTDVPDVALGALGRAGSTPAVTPRWGTPG